MKNQILLAVLAVYSSAVVADPIGVVHPEAVTVSEPVAKDASEFEFGGRSQPLDANAGTISLGDRLLYRQFHFLPTLPGSFHTQEFTYRTPNSRTTITAVRGIEIGPTQNAGAFISGGGINSNTVTIKFVSDIGRGWHFLIEIYGR